MAHKLLEKNGAEMMQSLVRIAVPLKHLMDDPEFDAAFKAATKKGLQTKATDVLTIYAEIVPQLLGDKHLKDTLAILGEIEGKTVKELLAMNGTDLLGDVLKAFNEQLKPFFQRLGVSVGVQQSST